MACARVPGTPPAAPAPARPDRGDAPSDGVGAVGGRPPACPARSAASTSRASALHPVEERHRPPPGALGNRTKGRPPSARATPRRRGWIRRDPPSTPKFRRRQRSWRNQSTASVASRPRSHSARARLSSSLDASRAASDLRACSTSRSHPGRMPLQGGHVFAQRRTNSSSRQALSGCSPRGAPALPVHGWSAR